MQKMLDVLLQYMDWWKAAVNARKTAAVYTFQSVYELSQESSVIILRMSGLDPASGTCDARLIEVLCHLTTHAVRVRRQAQQNLPTIIGAGRCVRNLIVPR
uniref:Uncharacterized protein n=2 Tax=Bombyx mori TaxID=7091 RepID=A0A8R2QUJ1_BOMMO|nr:uncharacterized protein LOC119628422 isoform X1 [Bombyx mori]